MSPTTQPPSSSPISWVPRGTVLGSRYELHGVIAGGGMGVVYRGVQLDVERPVAIKVLRKEQEQNASAKTRFLREARLLGDFRNARLPRLLDVGQHEDGSLFMVLELLAGSDLRRVLNRQEFCVMEAVDLVLQVCEAVAEAHDAGVVHRDIKPENIVFASEPDQELSVKLVDFGIALEGSAERYSWTSPRHTLGSPEYMAPEQFITPDEVDERADIWSLGAVLYELLVGSPPTRTQRLGGHAPVLVLPPMPPHVPEGLERAITRCLARQPERRFAGVRQLAEAIAPFATEAGRELGAALSGVESIDAWVPEVVRAAGAPGRSGVFAAPVIRLADTEHTVDDVKTLDSAYSEPIQTLDVSLPLDAANH